MTQPDTELQRRALHLQLAEVVARALHDAIPVHAMLILPASAGGRDEAWRQRLGTDEVFKASVKRVVSQTVILVDAFNEGGMFTTAAPSLELLQ